MFLSKSCTYDEHMAVDMSYKPTLTGRTIELHPFNDRAAHAMLSILRESEVLIKTGTVSSSMADNGFTDQQLLDWYATRNGEPDRLDLAIYSTELDKYVGEVVFNDYSPANRSANYRIAIGRRGRGRGFGTEATQLMIRYAFEELDLNRVELEVYEFNSVARHVYTSCGFVTEGRRRQALLLDGIYYDAIVKSILKDEWLEAKTPQGKTRCSKPFITI